MNEKLWPQAEGNLIAISSMPYLHSISSFSLGWQQLGLREAPFAWLLQLDTPITCLYTIRLSIRAEVLEKG